MVYHMFIFFRYISLGHSDAPKGLGKKETACSKGKEQALNGQAGSYGPRRQAPRKNKVHAPKEKP
eukprot:1160343-Pelagomonas_calceolata.AAC.2